VVAERVLFVGARKESGGDGETIRPPYEAAEEEIPF
jgi:hypothetical protein